MSTIAQKITYLNETKQLLKQSLNDLGAKITDEDTFRSYVDKINQLAEELPQDETEEAQFMATIDKLEYINNTKNLIKNALNTKFNSQIGDGDTFRSYAQKIDDI